MIAEILIPNWPTAAVILGAAAMLCGIMVMFLWTGFRAISSYERLPGAQQQQRPPEPGMYRNEMVTTTTEIDHDAIKAVLKEMGYNVEAERAATAESIAKVNAAMVRDYSALMKRIDEINESPATRRAMRRNAAVVIPSVDKHTLSHDT